MEHAFIFKPGIWDGTGRITFSIATDVLDFVMQWTILPMDEKRIYFNQEITINSLPERMRNHFTIWHLTDSNFEIQLENQIVGKVVGSGLITPKTIAWEFRRRDQEFEGFEIYELQQDGSYKMHAEFTAGEGMRTQVFGAIFPR
jgi:hypothetical protein